MEERGSMEVKGRGEWRTVKKVEYVEVKGRGGEL